MRKLDAAEFSVMPWKNGGGTTTQLALHPPGAGMDSFSWRVSMARVASDGPFSAFPGVDRSLAIVDGAGLRISAQDMQGMALQPASRIFRFPGETPIFAMLPDGPVTDFNVMTRRGAWSHALDRIRLAGDLCLDGADDALVYCLHGRMTCGSLELGAGEAAQCGKQSALDFRAGECAEFLLARFFEKGIRDA